MPLPAARRRCSSIARHDQRLRGVPRAARWRCLPVCTRRTPRPRPRARNPAHSSNTSTFAALAMPRPRLWLWPWLWLAPGPHPSERQRRGIPTPLGTVCRSARDPPYRLPVQTPATGRGGSPATRSGALGIGGNRGGARRSRLGDASAHTTSHSTSLVIITHQPGVAPPPPSRPSARLSAFIIYNIHETA